MTTVQSRLQFLITAKDTSRLAFASTQRSMDALNSSARSLRFAFGGLAGGSLIAAFVRSLVLVSRETPAVAQSFDNVSAAVGEFQRRIGEAGVNDFLVDLANTIARVFRGNNAILMEFRDVAFAVGESMDNLGMKSLNLGAAFTDLAANTVREFATITRTLRQFIDLKDKELFGPRSPLFTGAKGDFLGVPTDGSVLSNTAAKADQLAFSTNKVAASTRAARTSFRQLKQEMDPAQKAFLDFGDSFADAFSSIATRTQSVADAFRSMADSILADLTRLAVNKLFQTLAGSLFGGPTNIVPAGFGGARAGGGSVQAGKFYTVGEDGPEVLMAGASGHVIPSRGGGGTKVINNIITPPGFRAETSQRSGGRGVEINDIVIKSVEKYMTSARGQKVMGANFGMRPVISPRGG